MQKKSSLSVSIFVTSLILLTACKYTQTESTDLKNYRAANGQNDKQYQVDMIFGDFNGLSTETVNTNAYPIKMAVAAIVMRAHAQENLPISIQTYEKIMQRYGFFKPDRIANLEPGVAQPKFEYPAGIVHGTLDIHEGVHAKIEVGNLNCASCHGGVVYDAKGLPTKSIWFGSPNTSMNIQGYIAYVYDCLKAIRGHDGEVIKTLKQLYPNMDSVELQTMKVGVLGESARQMDLFESTSDDLLGYYGGPPGSANAIGAFKRMFGIIPHYGADEREVGYVNVPDMAYRGLKSNLTADGIYTVPGEKKFTEIKKSDVKPEHFDGLAIIASIFPVSVLGVNPARTEELIPELKKTVGAFFSNYRPPVFPGEIDPTNAGLGEKVFQKNCQSCHGQFEAYTPGRKQLELLSYPNKLIPQERIGTDPFRITTVTAELEKDQMATWLGKYVEAAKTDGYMPPVLSGLWATAPYLHNGSVPTLWQLMNPELRSKKFMTGGHKLDFTDVGISGHADASGLYRYDESYVPWAQPVIVDTSLPGQSNQGHEKPFANLSQTEKHQLLEYLKLL